MAKVFITGSADGLGQLSARLLLSQGHSVVLHARNAERAREAVKNNPQAETVLTGDLADFNETIQLAADVNRLGKFDAVIHNAGVYRASAKDILHVNTLAPYILTSLITPPARLIYLSSGMHLQGTAKLDSIENNVERISYSDSKLHVVLLALAVARKWNESISNAVDPGWVATKMGGKGAADDLEKGYETQSWLAVSDDTAARSSGNYFFHKKKRPHNHEADNIATQNRFLQICEHITGVAFATQRINAD